MSKNGKISKILAVMAGICSFMPQVGAVPPKMKAKNDVKFNAKGKMNRLGVQDKEVRKKVNGVRRSKSMRPLSRSMELKSHGSLAQDVRSTDPKIEVLKGKETFWRYSNGRVRLGRTIGIPFGISVGTILLIGGTYYVIKWVNGKKVPVPMPIEKIEKNEDDNIENLNINKIQQEKEDEANNKEDEANNDGNLKIDDTNDKNNKSGKIIYDKFIM